MLVAQNSLGPVCPVPLTVRGKAGKGGRDSRTCASVRVTSRDGDDGGRGASRGAHGQPRRPISLDLATSPSKRRFSARERASRSLCDTRKAPSRVDAGRRLFESFSRPTATRRAPRPRTGGGRSGRPRDAGYKCDAQSVVARPDRALSRVSLELCQASLNFATLRGPAAARRDARE